MPGNVIVSPPGAITIHDCWVVRALNGREHWRQAGETLHSRHLAAAMQRAGVYQVGREPGRRDARG